MDNNHLAYLSLLDELSGSLDRLTELAQKKSATVRQDDLIALNDVLKQEQAMSLALRGLEQKRTKLLDGLGLAGVPLSGLADRYPAELQRQARKSVETLQRSYKVYRAAADGARAILECNLHEIEKAVAGLGGSSPSGGAGYTADAVEPPKNMKTDFRA